MPPAPDGLPFLNGPSLKAGAFFCRAAAAQNRTRPNAAANTAASTTVSRRPSGPNKLRHWGTGPFPKSLALWWRRHEECSNAEKEFTRERANRSSSRVTPEPLRERVRLFRSKKIGRNFNVPRWRAVYFDRANGETPERSVIIAADNEAVALEEVRARMAPTCSRAEVTKLDPDSKTRRP